MKLLCLLLILCSCAAAAPVAPDLSFRADTVGGPDSNKRAELYLPPGPGPFPVVIVPHGCDGIGPHYRSWAGQLRDRGYAALHGFDAWHLPSWYAGHYTSRDPQAAEDALVVSREFLARHLSP
jgi:hypothetical protein